MWLFCMPAGQASINVAPACMCKQVSEDVAAGARPEDLAIWRKLLLTRAFRFEGIPVDDKRMFRASSLPNMSVTAARRHFVISVRCCCHCHGYQTHSCHCARRFQLAAVAGIGLRHDECECHPNSVPLGGLPVQGGVQRHSHECGGPGQSFRGERAACRLQRGSLSGIRGGLSFLISFLHRVFGTVTWSCSPLLSYHSMLFGPEVDSCLTVFHKLLAIPDICARILAMEEEHGTKRQRLAFENEGILNEHMVGF